MDAADVVGGHLNHGDEAVTACIGGFLAHVERDKDGAFVGGNGVVDVGVAGAIEEFVEDENLHVGMHAAAIGAGVALARTVCDEQIFGG